MNGGRDLQGEVDGGQSISPFPIQLIEKVRLSLDLASMRRRKELKVWVLIMEMMDFGG